jgi:hypothetical protein
MNGVISDVENERRRQNSRWGDVTGQLDRRIVGDDEASGLSVEFRKWALHLKKMKEAAGTLTWIDILRAKFFELASEPDDNWAEQRRVAIQVAAVVVAMVEAGDLRAQKAKDAAGANASESESS